MEPVPGEIILLSEDYPPYPGGIAQWAAGVARALRSANHPVRIVTRHRDNYPEVARETFPIDFIYGSRWKQFRTLYCYRWVRTMLAERTQPPAAVVATTWNMARGIAPVVKRVGIPLIVIVHGLEITRKMSFLKKRILRATLFSSKGVVAVSAFTANHVHDIAPGVPVRVAPNGVDSQRFRPGLPTETLRSRLDVGNDNIVLTLARVIERKGQDTVIRALPRVLEKIPDTTYIICGPYEADWYEHLQSLARSRGVQNKVLFTSYVPSDEIPLYYSLSDVYIMPSRELGTKGDTEGFGITYLEANACGKPVVGGNSGGVTDAIEHGVTGYLVDPLDTREIADRLIELLTNPRKARELGANGRKRVERQFTWEAAAGKVLGLVSPVSKF